MAQKLRCPMCGKFLIPNYDLVTDEKVVLDLKTIKDTQREVKTIKCANCKRRIRYFIDKDKD